jgi:hypothetical protein
MAESKGKNNIFYGEGFMRELEETMKERVRGEKRRRGGRGTEECCWWSCARQTRGNQVRASYSSRQQIALLLLCIPRPMDRRSGLLDSERGCSRHVYDAMMKNIL